MRILFLSRWFAYPPDNGSKIRIYHLLRRLAETHEVDLISFAAGPVLQTHARALREFCRLVQVVPYRTFRSRSSRAMLGYLSRQPRSVIDTFSEEMEMLAGDALRERRHDVVIASQLDMAPYATARQGVVRVLEELELTQPYERACAPGPVGVRLRAGLTWRKQSAYVTDLLDKFQGCTVVSEDERVLAERLCPEHIDLAVIPNGVDLDMARPEWGDPEPDTIVYAGALTYGPNFEAVRYFVTEILPTVRAARPGVQLRVTGSLEGVPRHRLPQSEGITLTGYLDDVRPVVGRSWVSVAPLLRGGGTRLKILESLALGTPVVANAKGAQGLDLIPGKEILIAEDPRAFAEALIRLLGDAELRARLSAAGREAVEMRYGWKAIGGNFRRFVERVADQNRCAEAICV